MSQFLVFVQKEFYHIFRDRWTTIIVLSLNILMIILFGFGINTEIRNTRFMVFSPSKDVVTQQIINKISSSEYFIFEGYLNTPTDAEEIFKKGKIGLIIVFEDNFSKNFVPPNKAQIEFLSDASDPNTAFVTTNYAANIVNFYIQEQMQDSEIPFMIKPEIKLLYNPAMKSAYSTVPGIMGLVLMLVCAMMTSVSITREKEFGAMEVLLVSPMKPVILIISKIIPYFILSTLNLTTILILAYYVLRVPINGSLILLILFSFLFITVSLSLGLLISTVAKTQLVALLVSGMGLMLPTIMLSGLMFPIESMPKLLQYLSHIIPAKWYIIGIRNVMIKGLGVLSIINEIIILSGFALLLITVSLKKFKIRLT